MSAAQDKLRQRVRALLDKSVARGCTEAEALAAAEKAAQLMRDHGLSAADFVMDVKHGPARNAGQGERARLWPVIGDCTNTSSVVVDDFIRKTRIEFIGHEPGPQIAVYLWTVLDRAIDRAIRDFKASTYYRRRRSLRTKREAVADFTRAMCVRLSGRLMDMFASTMSKPALLAARAARDARYPDAETIDRKNRETRHWEANAAGYQAGDKVNLAHGVSGKAAPLRIGGAS